MQTRDYKKFAQGEHYHIYNRGVGKIDIFKDSEDYANFIKRLKLVLGVELPRGTKVEALVLGSSGKIRKRTPWKRPLQIKPLPKGTFSIVSYCLMPNHYHFLIRQNSDISITKLIAKVSTSYAMYFNKKYNRVGTLFQDAFKAINVDKNPYLLWLSAYIHQNPAAAGIVWDLREWQWSSYPEYIIDSLKGGICEKDIILGQYIKADSYQKFVEGSFDEVKKNEGLYNFLFE